MSLGTLTRNVRDSRSKQVMVGSGTDYDEQWTCYYEARFKSNVFKQKFNTILSSTKMILGHLNGKVKAVTRAQRSNRVVEGDSEAIRVIRTSLRERKQGCMYLRRKCCFPLCRRKPDIH